MFLVRYAGDTGSGIQIETKLFMNKEAACAFMREDAQKDRELCAKYGAAWPETTSQEDEEYYTDISEMEIRVYEAGDSRLWQVIEIMPEDMLESLKDPWFAVSGDDEVTVAVGTFINENGDVSAAVQVQDSLLPNEEDIDDAILADLLGCEPDVDKGNGSLLVDIFTEKIPATLLSRIKKNGIREFLNGTFKIEPTGYDIFWRDSIGEEIQTTSEALFESDEDAVQQAIKDGFKIIPVEELPENFDYRYLGWIDTPENRKRIRDYCDRLRKQGGKDHV